MSVGRRDAGPTRPSCIIKIRSSRVVLLCNLLPSTIRCTCTTSRDISCLPLTLIIEATLALQQILVHHNEVQ